MKFAERHYAFRWDLKNSREKLWPLVADTNRFNHDTGLPPMITDGIDSENPTVRMMRLKFWGGTIRWREYPYEWVAPERFGVVRRYLNGPLESLRMQAVLEPKDNGTRLHYDLWIVPRNFIGWLAIPIQIGILTRNSFERSFRHYDKLATEDSAPANESRPLVPGSPLTFGARRRLHDIADRLVKKLATDSRILDPVLHLLQTGDDLSLNRMRPYALAKLWNLPRHALLDLFLHATREGLLDFSWEVLCPLCRGTKSTVSNLRQLQGAAHCETCNIRFDANLDQAVELVFSPNPAIKNIESHEFCVGGPQVTPHIIAQQNLPPSKTLHWDLDLKPGRYRLRAASLNECCYLNIIDGGPKSTTISLNEEQWHPAESSLDPASTLRIANDSENPQLVLLEQLAWMDDAVTAAEVTARQTFRDLFSSEVIAYGEKISVGNMTLVFTDLRGSTSLYEKIGDAPAFGLVMDHFEILKKHVAEHDGAIIKTMGDAIMAAFIQPVDALQAMLAAQEELATRLQGSDGGQPLALKGGIHTGPCIAINQDERLDYFGTTVNLTARLEGLSCGEDIVVSQTFLQEATVKAFLREKSGQLTVEPATAHVKGIEAGPVNIAKIRRHPAP